MSDVFRYEGFTKKEGEKDILACKAPVIIGHPSGRDLKYLVISNLENCSVTIPDVDNACKNFGPILGGVRGKTTPKNPNHFTKYCVAIPKYFWHCTSISLS